MSTPFRRAAGGDGLTAADRGFLARAVELGREGWGRVRPNPMVGAVVARGGVTLAEAHHAEFGGPHAEAAVLAELGERARGATLYSSLEPCAHTGKTPPCTETIRRAGIERVVFRAAEPGEEEGGGGEWLRSRGVRVAGPCGERADWAAENPVFYHAAASARPYVALKLAVSLDGRIAPGGGRRVWLTGPEARSEVYRLRAGFDSILVGTRTWKADDPMLTARGAVTPRVPPVPVLLDRRGEVAPGLRALGGDGGARAIVVTAPGHGGAGGGAVGGAGGGGGRAGRRAWTGSGRTHGSAGGAGCRQRVLRGGWRSGGIAAGGRSRRPALPVRGAGGDRGGRGPGLSGRRG